MIDHDEAIEKMSDVGPWNVGQCEQCGAPVEWRWTGLKAIAATGDEHAGCKEFKPIADDTRFTDVLCALQRLVSHGRAIDIDETTEDGERAAEFFEVAMQSAMAVIRKYAKEAKS